MISYVNISAIAYLTCSRQPLFVPTSRDFCLGKLKLFLQTALVTNHSKFFKGRFVLGLFLPLEHHFQVRILKRKLKVFIWFKLGLKVFHSFVYMSGQVLGYF